MSVGKVVLFVASNPTHIETLHIVSSVFAIAVDGIEYRTLVVAFIDSHILYVFAYKLFLGDLHNLIFSVLKKYYYVVDIRTVLYELYVVLFLEVRTDESFGTTNIEFFVGFHYFSSFDIFEIAYFGTSENFFTIRIFNVFEPLYSVVDQMI